MRIVALLLCALPAFSQVTSGALSGYVSDPSHRPMAQAAVSLSDPLHAVQRLTRTDNSGFFRFVDLAPSTYTLRTETPGFAPVTAQVVVQVNANIRADLHPLIAGRNESIEVADLVRPTLQSESSELGTVIERDRIDKLPLNERNFLQLSLLTPGVLPPVENSSNSTRGSFAMHANGGREEFNNFLLDGVDNNDQDTNRYVLEPSVDTIQEFKILTNAYSAEYGRSAGGQVNVVTRGGTNDFHGFAYDYLRNNVLDARNFFDGANASKLIRNQFGGGIGGPFLKNRTFFFADYDGLQDRLGFSRLATVPTVAQRNGDVSGLGNVVDPFTQNPFPNNQIPPSRIDPIAKKILNLYPLPANGDASGNYLGQPVGKDSQNQFTVRVDHHASEKDTLAVRYSYEVRTSFEPYAESSLNLPGSGDFPDDRGHNALVNYTRVLTPNATNELILGFSRAGRRILPQHSAVDVNKLWGVSYLPTNPVEFGYPAIQVLGLDQTGDVATLPIDRHINTYQITDGLSYVHGSHAFKIGAEFRKIELNGIIDVFPRGQISFLGAISGSGISDLLLGYPTFGIQSHRTAPQTLRTFSNNFYAQDDWKLTPKFTINLGVRYELNTAPTDPTNRMSVVDLATRSLVQVGTNGIPRSGVRNDYNNLAPRVGFAWSPRTSTVIRGGYGIFYDSGILEETSSLYFNPPYFTIQVFTPSATSLLTLENPFSSTNGFMPAASLSTVDPRFRTAYLQDWNLNIQHAVERVGTFSIAYAGSKGTHLIRSYDLNQPAPGPGDVDPRRPFQGFSNIFYIEPGANSEFHSLQLMFNRPLGHGLSVLATYMWSKSIDDTSAFLATTPDKNFPQDSRNYRLERGLSSFDVPHYGTLAFVYQAPWHNRLIRNTELHSILVARSGQPFTPQLTTDNSNTGNTGGTFGADRPNVVASPSLENPSALEWFNTAAFAIPPQYTFGNAGRNILRGPGYFSFDLAASRRFKVTERAALTFEAQAFNLTNHTNLDLPQLFVDQPGFGRILSAKVPRQIQLALRLGF